jgi:hypothetical protein
LQAPQVLQAFVLRSHLCCSGWLLQRRRQRLLRSDLCGCRWRWLLCGSQLCCSFVLLCSFELLQGEVLQALLARPLVRQVQELLCPVVLRSHLRSSFGMLRQRLRQRLLQEARLQEVLRTDLRL